MSRSERPDRYASVSAATMRRSWSSGVPDGYCWTAQSRTSSARCAARWVRAHSAPATCPSTYRVCSCTVIPTRSRASLITAAASARAASVKGSVGMSAAPRVGEDEDPLDGLAGHIDHVVGGGDRREVLILVASALAALGVDER